MSSTKSRFLSVAGGHVDSLIEYVLDVKPYHVKLSEIVENYELNDDVNVKVDEDFRLLAFLGADLLDSTPPFLGVRPRRTNSWWREITSDANRRIWSLPLTSVHKFLSHVSQDKFVAGQHNDVQISGIENHGTAFSPRRWDGPSVTDVRLNGVHQQESFHYFLSHGVFSFETRAGQRWKELNVAHVSAFAENAGVLLYKDVIKSFGSVVQIERGDYEEWTLTCIDELNQIVEVADSLGNVIGTCAMGNTFDHPRLKFTLQNEVFADEEILMEVGDSFVLTPFHKITVHAGAPTEVWSLIKVNPIVQFTDNTPPVFSPGTNGPSVRLYTPALKIHTRSLDRITDESSWSVVFNGDGTYNLTKFSTVNPYTIQNIDLKDGCSFKNEEIHFTIIPTIEGFFEGDTFNFTLFPRVENYLVHGSVSGWQPNAKIGEWYNNGKIAFKIPKLEYFATVYNTTVYASATGEDDSWQSVVANNQVLKNVSFNGSFYAAGNQSIIGGSTDGYTWTSTVAPPSIGEVIVIVGENGLVTTSSDGVTWVKRRTGVTADLNATTYIPDLLLYSGSPAPCIIVVGDNGTILTSATGLAWTQRNSGTTNNLNGVAWSNDAIIAVGDAGTIRRSIDRINWTAVSSGVTDDILSVIYEASINSFIAVGRNGLVLISTDGGLSWTSLDPFVLINPKPTFSSIAFGNGKFVAVGPSGFIAESYDGVSWNAYFRKRLNSIAFGNGVFVAVGGELGSTSISNFTKTSDVHSIAEPSVYTITFQPPSNMGDPVKYATVVNNIYGYRRALELGVNWSDEFCSFRIDHPGGSGYEAGDTIQVFLAPEYTYTTTANYDERPYDIPPYDYSVADITVPLLYNQEYFPLYFGHGLIVYKSVLNAGSQLVVDKALLDVIRFRIVGAARYPELAAVNDWLPLEFRYFDRPASTATTYDGKTAHFPDLTTQIEAYLCSDPTVKVFTIVQPRFECSNRSSIATITIDQDFFQKYLGFNTKYSFRVQPDSSYGQRLRVKVTENLRAFARVRLVFDDITSIQIDDSDLDAIQVIGNLELSDSISITMVEGGALPIFYDEDLYDVGRYDVPMVVIPETIELAPGIYDYTGDPADWVMPKPTSSPGIYTSQGDSDAAGASFVEGFSIAEFVGTTLDRLSVFYDFSKVPAEGLEIDQEAATYLVTHNGPAVTPTLLLESIPQFVGDPVVYASPIPNMYPFTGHPTVLSTRSFSFQHPPGFPSNFRLKIT